MKLRTYLALLRPGVFALRLLFAAGICVLLVQFAPGAGHRAGAEAFVALTLLLPYFVGREVSRSLHAVLHRPFSPLLPHLSRTLLRWHLPLLGLLAAVSATVVRSRDATLPWPVSASVALAGLCVLLPLEAPGRWFGSRVAAGTITLAVMLAALYGASVRNALHTAPGLTAFVALGVAGLCVPLGFSRRRLRVRAQTPLPEVVAAFDPAAQRELAHRQLSRRSGSERRTWPVRAVGPSTASWVRVVLHESFAFRGGWLRQVVLLAAITPVTALLGLSAIRWLDPAARQGTFGEFIYGAIWMFPSGRDPVGSGVPLLMLPLLFALAAGALPRPEYLYPLSRERRARVAFAVTMLQAGVQVPVALAALVVLAWTAGWSAGIGFHAAAAPRCIAAALAFLPFVPLELWFRFTARVRQGSPWSPLLGISVAFGIAGPIGNLARDWLVSGHGLATIALLTVGGLALYRRALIRFYRQRDLLPSHDGLPALRLA